MKNRISTFQDGPSGQEQRGEGPQPIGKILADLLDQYQVRFPEVKIVVAETPVAAV